MIGMGEELDVLVWLGCGSVRWSESANGAGEGRETVSGIGTKWFGVVSDSSESLSYGMLLPGMRLVRISDEKVKS